MKNKKDKFSNKDNDKNKKVSNIFLSILDKIQNSKKGHWITISLVVIFLFALFCVLVGVKVI